MAGELQARGAHLRGKKASKCLRNSPNGIASGWPTGRAYGNEFDLSTPLGCARAVAQGRTQSCGEEVRPGPHSESIWIAASIRSEFFGFYCRGAASALRQRDGGQVGQLFDPSTQLGVQGYIRRKTTGFDSFVENRRCPSGARKTCSYSGFLPSRRFPASPIRVSQGGRAPKKRQTFSPPCVDESPKAGEANQPVVLNLPD
jgi:hypothetical protein